MEVIAQRDYQLIRITICESMPGDIEGHRSPLAAIKRRFYDHRMEKCRTRMKPALKEELAPLLDEYGDNYIVYGDDLSRERDFIPLPQFDAYRSPKWIRRLLAHAVHDDFVVLGDASCLYEILRGLAPRMRTLLWIAPDLTAQEQTEDFAEDFYQEYGLAIDLRFLPDGGSYSRMKIPDGHFHKAVNVLDFTGGKYVPDFRPPKGSVWLDFDSLPEKERRIESRRLKAEYVSLQKDWRG